MTHKLLRDLYTLDDHTNLFNPGTVCHIESSDDDARSEMQTTMKMKTKMQANVFEEGRHLDNFHHAIKDVGDYWFGLYRQLVHPMMTIVHGSRLSEKS
jgi:hypothetical protein